MSVSEEQKLAIMGDLVSGITPAEAAKAHGVGYATVLRYKAQLDEALHNGSVDTLLDLPQVMVQQLIDQVKLQSPEGVAELVDIGTAQLGNKLTILDMAEQNFTAVANKLAERISVLAMSVNSPSELSTLADALATLQDAFFNKKITQVNVQNNYGAQESYKGLLQDGPGA